LREHDARALAIDEMSRPMSTPPDKLGTYLVRNHDGSIHRVVEP
jgi:hypothetical protein